MRNDILIVPDVHGRDFWLPAIDYQGEVIFLGDYTDPYPAENFTDEDAYQNLLKIVEFKQLNMDRVTLLIGNHELHYMNKDFQAGRFSSKYYPKFHKILTGEGCKELFQICKVVDNYLFIHAGVTKGWYELHRDEFQHLGATLEEQLNNIFVEKMSIFHEAAWKYRGGWDNFGSPLWADARELADEKEPFDASIIQIIGHTQVLSPEPYIHDRFWLLDNRQLYLLHNGVIERFVS